jgi:hypothetical protein
VVSRQSTKRSDGTLQVDLSLKVPMPRFGELVTAVKNLGRPERENVEGYNPAAINADPGAKDVMSTVALVIFEPSRQKPGGTSTAEFVLRCTQARFGSLLDGLEAIGRVDNKSVRGTLSAAFKTLWWLRAALIYGLIVVVPLVVAVAVVIKALVWMLRPRRRAAPTGGGSSQEAGRQ